MKKKIFVLTLVFTLLVNSVKVDQAEASPLIPVAGGAAAATYVYVALALAAAYGVSTIDEKKAGLIRDHALATYNSFNSTLKNLWQETIDSMTPTINTDYSQFVLPNDFSLRVARSISSVEVPITTSFLPERLPKDGSFYRKDYYDVQSVTSNLKLGMTYVAAVSTTDPTLRKISISLYYGSTSYDNVLYDKNSNYAAPGWEFLIGTTMTNTDFVNMYSFADIVTAGITKFYADRPTAIPTSMTLPADVAMNIPRFPTADATGSIAVPFPGITLNPDGTKTVTNGDIPIINTGNPTKAPTIEVEAVPPITGGGEYTGILGSIKGFLSDIWQSIKDILNYLKDILAKIWQTIKDLLASFVDGIASVLAALGIITAWKAIVEAIAAGVAAVAEFFGQGLMGDTAKIKWDKLKLSASGFTYAFPFSLPWDVGRAFDAVFGNFDASNPPEWQLKIHKETFTIKIPDMLLGWFPFTRAALLIMFDIGLIYSVRKLLGGAS